jgi:hypothetical protein
MGTAKVGKHGGRDWRPAPALLTACLISRPDCSADYRCAGTMLTGNFITSIRFRALGASAAKDYSTRTGVRPGAVFSTFVADVIVPLPNPVPGPRTKSG